MSKQKTTTMDCQKFNLELQKMLETASDTAAPEFIAHTNTCSRCQMAYQRVKQLLSAISTEKESTPGFYLQGKIMDRIMAEAKATVKIRPIRWETAVTSLVAGIALGLMIGSVSYISTSNSAENSLTASIAVSQETEDTTLEEYIFTSENDK